MIQIGKYTFASEADRAADYRARVGPLRRPRTGTIERPDPSLSLAGWLDWLRERYLERL
jgi:hypothetical protein